MPTTSNSSTPIKSKETPQNHAASNPQKQTKATSKLNSSTTYTSKTISLQNPNKSEIISKPENYRSQIVASKTCSQTSAKLERPIKNLDGNSKIFISTKISTKEETPKKK